MPETPAITLPTWDQRDQAAADLQREFRALAEARRLPARCDVDAVEDGLAAIAISGPIECRSAVVMRMLLQRDADEAQIARYRRTG